MNAMIAALDGWALFFPGLITIILFLPLLPHVLIEAIFEGDHVGVLALLALVVYFLAVVISALSGLVEKLLVACGILARLTLEGLPAWLTESVLRRAQEHLGVDPSRLALDPDSGRLEQSESESLFILMWTFVSEQAQAPDGRRFSAMAVMFRNLLTVFGLAAIVYPLVQPYPLTPRLNYSLGQRLLISAVCGVLSLISVSQARSYRDAFRRDVINRFVATARKTGAENKPRDYKGGVPN